MIGRARNINKIDNKRHVFVVLPKLSPFQPQIVYDFNRVSCVVCDLMGLTNSCCVEVP